MTDALPPAPATPADRIATASAPVEAGGTAAPAQRRARVARGLWLGLGAACFGLGAAGTVLPLLPTTPFMMLAAACWARSSPRFHRWLLHHRLFGPTLRTWSEHRALPPGVKPKAIVLVVLVFATSGWLAFTTWPPRTGLAALGLGLVVFLVRLPEREAPPADRRLPSGTDPRPAS